MQLGDQLLESLDCTASAHSRVDRIAACADALVLRLKVKSAVKVQSGTILVEHGTDPARSSKNKVDLLWSRKESTSNCTCPYALGAFAFLPFELRKKRARLDRYSKDHLVLYHEAGDRLTDYDRLSGEQAEEQGHELEDRPRDHLRPTAISVRFAAKR